jgi:hypothetical protein
VEAEITAENSHRAPKKETLFKASNRRSANCTTDESGQLARHLKRHPRERGWTGGKKEHRKLHTRGGRRANRLTHAEAADPENRDRESTTPGTRLQNSTEHKSTARPKI